MSSGKRWWNVTIDVRNPFADDAITTTVAKVEAVTAQEAAEAFTALRTRNARVVRFEVSEDRRE